MLENKDNVFQVDHLSGGLKKRAISGAKLTIGAQLLKLIIQIISITVLARLLEPKDFGLVAMVTVFLGVAQQLVDGGLSSATIQRDKVTHQQASLLFWLNCAIGALLCILVIIISPLVSYIYDEPRLTTLTIVMSSMLLIGGLSVQHEAILFRQMRFGSLAIIDLVSMGVGVLSGIAMALNGAGYWAIAISPIVVLLIKTLLRWSMLAWIPSVVGRAEGVNTLIKFGANLTGANLIGQVAVSITPLCVGHLGGAQILGFFNRANTLISIPTNQMFSPIMSVLQPTLARAAVDLVSFRHAIISTMGKLLISTVFVTLIMVLTADLLVDIFLGENWSEAVPIFRMLALFSFVEPLAGLLAVSLIAAGKTKELLRWKLISLCILFISIIIGWQWGANGIITAYSLSGLLLRLPLFLFYCTRYLPVSLSDFKSVMLPQVFCVTVTMLILVSIDVYLENSFIFLELLLKMFMIVTFYVGFCMCFKVPKKDLWETKEILASMVRPYLRGVKDE